MHFDREEIKLYQSELGRKKGWRLSSVVNPFGASISNDTD